MTSSAETRAFLELEMAQSKRDIADRVEPRWAVAQGEYNGKPMIVGINKSAAQFVGDNHYTHRVGCAVPFHESDDNGFPSSPELPQLLVLEDALCRELEQGGKSILVLRITTNGMREFVFYSGDPEFVKQRCMAVGDEITSHDFQLVIEPDPDWTVYRQFSG
jgi:hypothetical protein